MLNRVMLIGNLGKEPEVRRLENGAVVARFSLATNKNYKDKAGEWQTQTEWHNITVWREQAERAEKTLKKGSTVYVEGELSTRKYTDANGVEKYTTDIVANMFRLLDKREGGGGVGGGNFPTSNDEPSYPSNGGQPETPPPAADDDLPF